MISAEEARTTAEKVLEKLGADSGRPLAIFDGQFGLAGVEDYGDVWVVNWNSVEFLATGNQRRQVLSGPIVVPKDGSEWFVLGTAGSTEHQLARWRDHFSFGGPEGA